MSETQASPPAWVKEGNRLLHRDGLGDWWNGTIAEVGDQGVRIEYGAAWFPLADIRSPATADRLPEILEALKRAERALDLRRQLEDSPFTDHETLDPSTVLRAEGEALALLRDVLGESGEVG